MNIAPDRSNHQPERAPPMLPVPGAASLSPAVPSWSSARPAVSPVRLRPHGVLRAAVVPVLWSLTVSLTVSLTAGCSPLPVIADPAAEGDAAELNALAAMPADAYSKALVWASIPAAAVGAVPDEEDVDLDPLSDRRLFDHLDDGPLVERKDPPADAKPAAFRSVPREALASYLEGRRLFQTRKFNEAVKELERARSLDPKGYQAGLLLGRIWLMAGQRDRAAKVFGDTIADTPENFEARYYLGRLLYEDRKWSEAAGQLLEGLAHRTVGDEIGPRAAQAWLYLARSLQESGKPADAVRCYRNFLNAVERGVRPTSGEDLDLFRLSGNPTPVFEWIARCYLAEGRKDKAVVAAECVLNTSPAEPLNARLAVNLMIDAGQAGGAVTAAGRHLVRAKDLRPSMELLEHALKAAGRPADAVVEVLSDLRRKHPRDERIARTLIEKLRAAGKAAEADALEAELDKGKVKPPEDPVGAAAAKEKAGDRVGAVRALCSAMAVTRDEARQGLLAGVVAETLARDADAEALLTRLEAVQSREKDDDLAFAVGLLSLSRGKPDRAVTAFTSLIGKRPKLVPAHERLSAALVAAAQADPKNFLPLLERAVGVNREAAKAGLGGTRFQKTGAGLLWELYLVERAVGGAGDQTAGRMKQVLDSLQEVLAVEPKDGATRALYAEVLFDSGDAKAAGREALVAMESAPDNERALDTLVRSLCSQNQADKALEAADAFLARKPDSVPALRSKALVQRVMRDVPGAAETLEKALEKATEHRIRRVLRLQLGNAVLRGGEDGGLPGLLVELKDHAGAAEQLRLLIEEDARQPEPKGGDELRHREVERTFWTIKRADLLGRAGKADDAKALLDGILRNDPMNLSCLRLRLVLQCEAGDDAAAAAATKDLRQALLDQGSDAARADLAVAQCLLAGGRIEQAERLLKSHTEAAGNVQARLMLVQCLSDRSRAKYEEAAAILGKILDELDPENKGGRAMILRMLSGVHTKAKDNAKAAEVLEQAWRLDPEDPGLNNDLGYTWADLGRNLKKAKEMLDKAVAAEPYNAAYRDSLGWVLYKLGDFKAAREELRKAGTAWDGSDPVLWDHLGDCLWRLGERRAAQDAWQRSVQLFGEKDHKDEAEATRVRAKLKAAKDNQEPAVAPTGESEAK